MKALIVTLVFLLAATPSLAGNKSQPAVLDFDGDGKTDIAVTREDEVWHQLEWHFLGSTTGFTSQLWGSPGDLMVPEDYDGDGRWDIAVWRPGSPAVFYILQSSTGTLRSEPFGMTGDDPRSTQDFDGDGKADPLVTREADGKLNWYMQRSALGYTAFSFGRSVWDSPMRGDFDGDGKADIAVYRYLFGDPANTFFVLRSSDGAMQAQNWGVYNLDLILPGDFDGDGKTDYAVMRFWGPDAGYWYWLRSSDGAFEAVKFGSDQYDYPVVGDYDGDGISDPAYWRREMASPTFFVHGSLAGDSAVTFGLSTDIPTSWALQAR